MASARLEGILAAMFEAEFCPPEHKQAREQARDALLKSEAERVGIQWERLKFAISPGATSNTGGTVWRTSFPASHLHCAAFEL